MTMKGVASAFVFRASVPLKEINGDKPLATFSASHSQILVFHYFRSSGWLAHKLNGTRCDKHHWSHPTVPATDRRTCTPLANRKCNEYNTRGDPMQPNAASATDESIRPAQRAGTYFPSVCDS